MATTITISADNTKEIDLGNSKGMSITANGGDAKVYIDYKLNGSYSSAVKGSAGLGNPFTVRNGHTRVVTKTDLESEHVRVGVEDSDISVTY